MKTKALFLLLLITVVGQASCIKQSIFSWRNVGIVTAASIGAGSLAWQVYHKDYSLSKSLFTGACFLGSFLFYASSQGNVYKSRSEFNLPRIITHDTRRITSNYDKDYRESDEMNECGSRISVVNAPDFGDKVNAYLSYGDFSYLKELILKKDLSLTEPIYNGYGIFHVIAQKQDWDKLVDIPLEQMYVAINLFTATHDITDLERIASNNETAKKFRDIFIEACNEKNETPLQTAIRWGKRDNIIFLLKQAANPLVKTDNGKTVLELAKYYELSKDVIECITEHQLIWTELRKLDIWELERLAKLPKEKRRSFLKS